MWTSAAEIAGVLVLVIGVLALYFDKLQLEAKNRDLESRLASALQVRRDDTEVVGDRRRPLSNLPSPNQPILRSGARMKVRELLHQERPVVILSGLPGIGKLQLAIAAVNDELEAFAFENFIWAPVANLRSTLGQLLDLIAREWGHPEYTKMAMGDKQYLVEQALREHPTLLLIDRVEDLVDDEIIRFLVNLPALSRVLLVRNIPGTQEGTHRLFETGLWSLRALTFRRSVEDLRRLWEEGSLRPVLHRAYEYHVDLLDDSDARILLDSVLGDYTSGGRHITEDTRRHMVLQCAGSPALILSAAAMAARGLDWHTLLGSPQLALDKRYQRVYKRLWNMLTPASLDVVSVLWQVPEGMSRAGVQHLTQYSDRSLDDIVRQLYELHLLRILSGPSARQPRYALTSAFRTHSPGPSKKMTKRVTKLLASYFVRLAGDVKDSPQNYEDLENEWPNVRNLMCTLWTERADALFLDLYEAMTWFLGVRGYWDDRLEFGELALESARSRRRYESECRVLVDSLGWIHLQLRDEKARETIKQGLARALEAKPSFTDLAALAYCYLAQLDLRAGSMLDASANISLGLASEPDAYSESRLLKAQGDVLMSEQDLEAAQSAYQRSLALREKSDPTAPSSPPAIQLGHVMRMQGQIAGSRQLFEQAVKNAQDMRLPYRLPPAHYGLGLAQASDGKPREALEALGKAADGFRKLGAKVEAQEVEATISALRQTVAN